jgi:hypothetical protein
MEAEKILDQNNPQRDSDSWFSKLDEISEKYSLNSPHDLIVNPSTKSSWNRSVGTTINKYYVNLHIGQRELTSPFLANFALCSCRVSVPVASFTLTAAIVTANGKI